MTTKIIPESKITICDGCGVVCTNDNRRESGVLHLKRDGLDWSGHAVADASIRRDLCDTCLHVVSEAINAAFVAHQHPKGDQA